MDELIQSLDVALAECEKVIKPLTYVEPANRDEQKEAFFAGRISNPMFTYEPLAYDPDSVAHTLNGYGTAAGDLGTLLENKREELLLKNMLIANRDDGDLVQEVTSYLYGQPDAQLVSRAEGILERIPPTEYTKDMPAEEVRSALQEALYEHGLSNWGVHLSDKRLTTIYAPEQKVTVCGDRLFARNDPQRQKVHEIGVHALRAANGYEQPLHIFATGLAGYLPTEEGLSLYCEELTGTTDMELMRDYAARVIAVDSVCQGLDFCHTYERLRDHDLSAEQAWQLGVRAHRGGGYIKDHVYLQGLRLVEQFAETNGDFETLYTGKVGINDYEAVSRLLDEGFLTRPAYIPDVLAEQQRVT